MADVRLIVDLFEDINFGGSFRTLVRDLNDFRLIEFNDRASSVIVTAGPNIQSGDAARLWEDINFSGRFITLVPGQYPDLRVFNFNDIASSMNIVGRQNIIAEDRQQETLQFILNIITPPGTTLVSVQENRILNPTATGVFVGETGVRVTGSFTDQIVVLIRDSSGATRLATGSTTLTFTKNINFPQLAGLNKANLAIRVSITNITSSFTLAGNILTKTIRFDLTTQVVSLLTGTEQELLTNDATVEISPEFTVTVE